MSIVITVGSEAITQGMHVGHPEYLIVQIIPRPSSDRAFAPAIWYLVQILHFWPCVSAVAMSLRGILMCSACGMVRFFSNTKLLEFLQASWRPTCC